MAKARAAWPPIAQRRANGGLHWAERYRSLPPEERQRIAIRCVVGLASLWCEAGGFPAPIIHTYEPELGPDGKLKAKSGTMRPMTNAEIEAL